MTTMFLLSGIPGSGKSTLAHQLSEQHNAVVHSYDDIPGANVAESMGCDLRSSWLCAIKDDLEIGKSVVCDGVNLTTKERSEVLAVISCIPCKKVLIVKAVPLEICLQRNATRNARLPSFVLEQAARKIEPPTKEECWDEILISKD